MAFLKYKVRAALCAAFAVFGLVLPAHAQDVTLTFPDGSLAVSGPLVGFDGTAYRVDTRFGVLTIAADQVECEGDCPDADFAPLIRMAGVPALTEILMPALVDAFALSLGLRTIPEPVETPDSLRLALIGGEGQVLARYEISTGTSADAFERLSAQKLEIALTDREATGEERNAALAAGIGDLDDPLRRRLVARRVLRIHVPRESPVAEITVGAMQRWLSSGPTEGLPEAAIAAENLGLLQSALGDLNGFFEGADDPSLPVEVVEDREELAELLLGPSTAIITHEPVLTGRALELSHGCTPGSATNAEGEAHPLKGHLWAYTGAARLPDLGRAFLAFLKTAEAQRVVSRAGFIDGRPRGVTLDDQGRRLAAAVAAVDGSKELTALQETLGRLEGHERLTASLRFSREGGALTPKSRNVAQSLAAALDSGRFDGREVLFVGLTGRSTGSPDDTAQAGAALGAVRDMMITRPDRVVMAALDAGSVFPLDCDQGPWSDYVNRRVEIWVGPEIPG
ncbi:MAG: hypothetical protein AAGI10_06290 [Pseudomonadota bacterium]